MKTRVGILGAFLVAAGASIAIAAAPGALAEPSCETTSAGGGIEGGGTTLCQSPGDAEINSHPSVYPTEQMGGMGYGVFPWEGGMWAM